jgi:UDP-MurNAc hydroxylase
VRVTGTGHAGIRIDTPAGSILCDPWVNPAFFASWFPFPDNSQLDWERLGHSDYLYISHLHRDHFDAAHLRRFVSKSATVLLPDFPTAQLEDELRVLGFTTFVRTRSNEPIALGGGLTVMIQTLTSPSDGPLGDSSLWVEHDGIRLLNQNDARPTNLSEVRKLGPVHAHLLQFSGAIWYPMAYDLPTTTRRELGRRKRSRQFDRTIRYVDDLDASWVFPIAGPPCFLDDELWSLNDLGGDEGNIFMDQQAFIDRYRERGYDNGMILLPGSVADITSDECLLRQPVSDVRCFFAHKAEHLRAYRERQRPVIEAEKASWHHPEIDVFGQMKKRIEPLLSESTFLADRVGGPVLLELVDDDDGSVEQLLIDFTARQLRRYADEEVRYQFRTKRCPGRAPPVYRRDRLGEFVAPLVSMFGETPRTVQRGPVCVPQVPVDGAPAVRRRLVRRTGTRRGRLPARWLGRPAPLPASQGRPESVRGHRGRRAHVPDARLAVRPRYGEVPYQR